MESRTRGAGNKVSHSIELSEQLSSHQNELEEQMRVEALERLRKDGGGASGPSGPVETPIAYNDANLYPLQGTGGGSLKTNQTYVDGKAETVLIPIFGQLVPFHISTIKNVSKTDEGGNTVLRINFGADAGGDVRRDAGQQQPPPAPTHQQLLKPFALAHSLSLSLPLCDAGYQGDVARVALPS